MRPAYVQSPPPEQSRGVGFVRGFLLVLGDLLITIGLVLLLYVVWQLWWTTVEVQGGMSERIVEFQDMHPAVETVTEERRTDDPPTVGEVAYGEVFGVLHVPKWEWMEIPIVQGTTPEILDLGNAGHYVDTQMPGEIGNFALAGHRRTYGNNFRRVDILYAGDPIVVETADAWMVYEVTDSAIVWPHQTEVLLPTPNEPGVAPTKRIMTMTTCHPEFGNSERFIVWSEMMYWVPKDAGVPKVLSKEASQ